SIHDLLFLFTVAQSSEPILVDGMMIPINSNHAVSSQTRAFRQRHRRHCRKRLISPKHPEYEYNTRAPQKHLIHTVPRQKFANFSRFPRVPHQTCFYPHFQITMPRRPLPEISANSNQRGGIEGRFELTSNWRSHIVDRACGGQSPKAIAEDLQIPLSTIYSTVSRNKTHFDNESLHRPGCPNIVSDPL